MLPDEFVRQGTMGGPGLRAYAYNANVYCPDCAARIYQELADTVAPTLSGTDDPLFSDSETCPQPAFFPESDTAQYCADCGAYLYGPEEDEEDEEPEPQRTWVVKCHAYSGMTFDVGEWDADEAADARQCVAQLIRRRRREGFPVTTLRKGERWEVLEPEDCIMVPDQCGTITLREVERP